MAKLENITVGCTVKGIIGPEPVTIIAVQWYGTNVLEITYKDTHNPSISFRKYVYISVIRFMIASFGRV